MKLKPSSASRAQAKPKRPRRFFATPALGNERPTRVYSLLLPPTPPSERR
jgi:hypothetical protein